jgi:replicative DNA helicase
MRLVVLDRAGATLAEVRSLARKIRAQHGDLALIVLDYLQLMTPPERRKGGTREEEVSQLSRGAKQLAGELNCAVLALSQLNRAADGQRPKLSHLRESGAIEQDANSILFLHSEGEGEAGALTSEGEVIVAAQRSGPTGAAPVLFRNAWTTFIDVAAGDVAGARESSPDLDDFDNPGGYAVGGYTGNVVPMRRHGSDE